MTIAPPRSKKYKIVKKKDYKTLKKYIDDKNVERDQNPRDAFDEPLNCNKTYNIIKYNTTQQSRLHGFPMFGD